MYGSSISKLTVYQRYSTLDFPSPILLISGSQGDAWMRAEERIDIEVKFQVRSFPPKVMLLLFMAKCVHVIVDVTEPI